MKSWNTKTKSFVETPEEITRFLNDIENVCKKHYLSLSHEDSHGAFKIEKFKEFNIDWLKNATLDID